MHGGNTVFRVTQCRHRYVPGEGSRMSFTFLALSLHRKIYVTILAGPKASKSGVRREGEKQLRNGDP